VHGYRPEIGYIRPQDRGYELQLVSRYGCWYSRRLGWNRIRAVRERISDALTAESTLHGQDDATRSASG
jgi:hypothetical protein